MGSIIPQAADIILTMPNCWWLIHDGTTDIMPDFVIRQKKAWHEWEERLSKQMLDIYVESCQHGLFFTEYETNTKIKNFLKRQLEKKEDWWISSEEAVNYGFATDFIGSKQYPSLQSLGV
jgi:hypothetical protein